MAIRQSGKSGTSGDELKRRFLATVDGKACEFFAELLSPGCVRVYFGENATHLDVTRLGDDHYLALQEERVFHLGFTRQGSEWQAQLNGDVLTFDLKDEKMLLRSTLGGGLGAAASGDVKSPMPGRVAKILVAPGQAIKAGDPVIVVEAMKMENEFKAKKDGIVREIKVAAGETVEGGAVLIKID